LRSGYDNLRVFRNGIDLGRPVDYISHDGKHELFLALSLFETNGKI
jgi:hypothetical protein